MSALAPLLQVARDPVSDERPRRTHRPRVVVIDDSVSVCKAVERMVGHAAEVVAIHSGKEAVARLEQERPDLVICDLVLPDLEGSVVCRFVRESRLLRRVPILAITGLVSDTARRAARDAGADALLRKPFRREVLLADLDALLAGTQQQPQQPLPHQPPAPIREIVSQMEELTGLASGFWWLATGIQKHFRPQTGDHPAEPVSSIDLLRQLSRKLDLTNPSIALIESDGGKSVLVAQCDQRGGVILRLDSTAVLGKARLLARKFLNHLRLEHPSPSSEGAESWIEPVPTPDPRS